ncbi:MAG TPA: hypothetical protein VEW03_02250 [Longimicrobiaceae bacterium]|nr:hypothetical protein [Longimicrobiaceae bacterium]
MSARAAARAALAIANAVACAAFLYMSLLAALRGLEALGDPGAPPADVWVAVLFCAVMGLSGVAAFLAATLLAAHPAAPSPAAARRAALASCAAAAVAHAALSVAALASRDPLVWLLLAITLPAALLLAASWAVLRLPMADRRSPP